MVMPVKKGVKKMINDVTILRSKNERYLEEIINQNIDDANDKGYDVIDIKYQASCTGNIDIHGNDSVIYSAILLCEKNDK